MCFMCMSSSFVHMFREMKWCHLYNDPQWVASAPRPSIQECYALMQWVHTFRPTQCESRNRRGLPLEGRICRCKSCHCDQFPRPLAVTACLGCRCWIRYPYIYYRELDSTRYKYYLWRGARYVVHRCPARKCGWPKAYNSETCYLIEIPLAAKVSGSALPVQRKSRPQKGQVF